MTLLRRHLVAVVAVFLALAVGIALGGGPLSDVGEQRAVASEPPEPEIVAEAGAGDAFAGAVAPRVLRNRLSEQRVALVGMPGADDAVLTALSDRVDQADGRVVGRYAVTSTVLQPGQKQLVDTLGSQLVAEYGRGDIDGSAPTYERLGQLFALAIATTDADGDEVGKRSSSVLASLAGADAATAEGEPRRRAPLILVVLGEEPAELTPTDDGSGPSPDAEVEAEVEAEEEAEEEAEVSTDAILSGLVAGLAEGAVGVLLAGSTDSGASGALARVRDERLARLSTLDGVETAVGQVSAPLALALASEGIFGAYGASGSDGAVPLG